MPKLRITKREIMKGFPKVIKVGYCQLQHLLGDNPQYYTCGRDGWNADIYVVSGSTVIVTGYNPFGNVKTDYNLNKKYDERALKIILEKSAEGQKIALKNLMNEYVSEAILLGGLRWTTLRFLKAY